MADDKKVHLWEVDHPFYAESGNYFDNNCHVEAAAYVLGTRHRSLGDMAELLKVMEERAEDRIRARWKAAHPPVNQG